MGKVLSDIANNDERIVVLTADLGHSNRTIEFADHHPDRFFNMGIAERNMVSVAAGMAATGFIPYVATFASFLALICCEEIRTDLAYTNLPVRLLSHHSGISLGYYGTSHHATEDIGIMRSMANVKIVCPSDKYSLEQALRQTVDLEGPVYIRIGRGRDPDVYRSGEKWEYGKISILESGMDGLVLANGSMVSTAREASAMLAREGIKLTIADLHTIIPIDVEKLTSLVKEFETVFVIEEHNTRSGVATAVSDVLSDFGLLKSRLIRFGFPPYEYAITGPPYYLYKYYGLTPEGVARRIRSVLK